MMYVRVQICPCGCLLGACLLLLLQLAHMNSVAAFTYTSCTALSRTSTLSSRNQVVVSKSHMVSLQRLSVGQGHDQEEGQHSMLGFDQACLLSGFHNVDQFERIDDIWAESCGAVPPVIILGKKDSDVKLRDIITQKHIVQIRDHELPEKVLDFGMPVMIISSRIERETVMQYIRKYRQDVAQGMLPACAFAVTVPAALEKSFDQLIDEIIGDFKINRQN